MYCWTFSKSIFFIKNNNRSLASLFFSLPFLPEIFMVSRFEKVLTMLFILKDCEIEKKYFKKWLWSYTFKTERCFPDYREKWKKKIGFQRDKIANIIFDKNCSRNKIFHSNQRPKYPILDQGVWIAFLIKIEKRLIVLWSRCKKKNKFSKWGLIWFNVKKKSGAWATFDRLLKTWADLIQLSLKKVEFDRPLIVL